MIANSAPLEIIDFKVKAIQFQYIASTTGEDFEEYNTYPINLDFDFVQGVGKNFFTLEVKLSSNFSSDMQPGYSYKIDAMAEFFFNEEKFNSGKKTFTIFQNGLEILIGQVRGYLASISAFCPVGIYHLPTLDLIKLMERKFQELQKTHPQMKVVKNIID
jgi:hypothetical protein